MGFAREVSNRVIFIDEGVIAGHPAVNVSFVLPLICFLIVTIYGLRSYKKQRVME
jgi:FHS family L-fucose permease-like MFS transporter